MLNLKSALLFLIDLIVFAIVSPLILVIFCILYIYKSIITIIAKLVDPTLSPLESRVDSFVSMEKLRDTKNVMGNVGWIIQVDGKVDIKWLRKKFDSSFLGKNNYKNYHRYFTTYIEFWGYTFRKTLPPSTIDLNLQIFESEVPENLSLNEFIRIWFNKPHKALHPLWEIMLVSRTIDEKIETFVLYKMHHNLGDGYTIINLLDVLTDSETPYVVKEFNDTLLDKLSLMIKAPRTLLCYALNIFMVTQNIPLPVNLPEDKYTPPFHTTMTFNLKDFKEIRNKTGVNFQSIALSIFAGLARRIALENKDPITDNTYVLSPLPWPNHPKPKMANHCTSALFKVPLKEMSPVERLIEVDQNYKFVLDNQIHKILYHYYYFQDLYPAQIMRKIVSTSTGLQFGVTGLMGSSSKNLYLNGQWPIKTAHLLTGKTTPNSGLIALCFSHSGKFNFTLIGAKDVFKSQERADTIIQKYFREEFELLIASLPEVEPMLHLHANENIV